MRITVDILSQPGQMFSEEARSKQTVY